MAGGIPTHHKEIVALDENLGMFAIDDNDDLPDPALPKFIFEVKDMSLPASEHDFMPNDGWKRMTTQECFSLLESAGVIERL